MRREQAEKILKGKGYDVTIAHAHTWIGSLNACQRAMVNPKKKWAYSQCIMSALYEPTTFFDDIKSLVESINY